MKNKNFRVTMQAEIDVSFSDPVKAKAYFIDGEWKNHFYDIEDIEDLAKNIAHSFHFESKYFNIDTKSFTRSVEGFGLFHQQEGGSYKSFHDDFGAIFVRYEQELEAESAYELS